MIARYAIDLGVVFGPAGQREKNPERKRIKLIRLGNNLDHAYAWSSPRMGGRAVALRLILGTTITLNQLARRGYIPMLNYYLKVTR